MKNSTRIHLEEVSSENLLGYKSECFSCFACSHGAHGHFFIGVNGYGQYEVRADGRIFVFDEAFQAVKFYKAAVSAANPKS